ncbi:uncharacterized protein LOC112041845 [Lingula anatina]|uniref:Uncharacterized protein LOC112041845 n=1 Tax=Lingula anatina TaxID=7574 RepID=A0A2R2MM57_LINAN|nr:uncharacterized protein LOC112041845 [Lingula anatina]|eukprot:XP_023931313.1 uncharacterized protein LOC112041845 [Lingula anatina]
MVKKKLRMAMKPAGDGHSYIIKLKENAIVGAAVVNMGDAIRKNSKNIFAAGVKKVTTVGRKKFLKVRAEKRAIEEVLDFNDVDYIEQDVQVSAAAYCATESNIASWGKDSLDKRTAVMDNKYSPLGNDGAVVRTYVVDSGVRQDHDEFTGRLILGPSYTNDNPQPSSGEDQFNHGTLVASAIAGNLYGASNKATLVSVRILDGQGNGFTSDLVTAIGYAITDCGQQQGIRCTINLSLSGGGTSQAAADAIEQAVQANIPVIGAAGNGGYDSCNTVPGSAPEAIVVGAVDNQFAFPSSISNYGTCIDILAAGVDILGASSFGPTATTTKSGTSFATAYVTGVVNDYLSAVPSASVLTVKQFLSGWATRNAVSNVPSGTDNVLLYVGCFW